jgi:hypothetical protein
MMRKPIRPDGRRRLDAGGNPVIPIVLTFPVASMPAGAHTLEVRVTHDNEQDTVVR